MPSSDGGSLTAFSTRGRYLWRIHTGGYVYSSPAVWGGNVYFGSYNGRMYAVSASRGRVLWSVGAGGPVSGAAVVVDKVAYAGSTHGSMVGADARNGRVLFRFPHGEYVPVSGNGARLLLHRLVLFTSRPLARPESVYLLAASLLVALNFADLALTRAALDAGATELNPVARFFVDHAVIAYTIKLGVPVAVLSLALTHRVQSRLNEVHVAVVWMIVGMYVMTVFMNVVTLTRYV